MKPKTFAKVLTAVGRRLSPPGNRTEQPDDRQSQTALSQREQGRNAWMNDAGKRNNGIGTGP